MSHLLLTAVAAVAALQGDAPASRPKLAPDVVAFLDRLDAARLPAPGAKRPASLAMRGRFELTLSGAPVDKPWRGPIELDFAEGRAYERMDYGDKGLMQRGWNGSVTWQMHPVSGVEIYKGNDEAVIRRCLQTVYWPGWRALYVGAEITGVESRNGRPHRIARLAPETGKPDVWHVDQETMLPSRIDFVIPWAGSESTISVEFSEWKPAGGLLVAHKEKTTMGATWGETTYDSVVAGAPIDAARFALPAEVANASATSAGGGFQVTTIDAQPTATIRVSAKREEISKTLAVVLPEVMAYLNETGARTAGAPFARFHGESNGVLDLEAGLPVQEKVAGKGRVRASELPAGRAATAWHLGPYSKLPEVHARLEAWMQSQNLAPRGGPWEIYWTDPGLETDSAKWRTQILWPVQ